VLFSQSEVFFSQSEVLLSQSEVHLTLKPLGGFSSGQHRINTANGNRASVLNGS
jgi:hypothetical protein